MGSGRKCVCGNDRIWGGEISLELELLELLFAARFRKGMGVNVLEG